MKHDKDGKRDDHDADDVCGKTVSMETIHRLGRASKTGGDVYDRANNYYGKQKPRETPDMLRPTKVVVRFG